MANPALSTTIRANFVNDIRTQAGSGCKLKHYTSPRPASGASITTQTLLCTHTWSAYVANTSSDGVLTGILPPDATPVANGDAAWCRLESSGGTFVADFDEATSGTNAVVVSSVTYNTAIPAKVLSFNITAPNA